MSLSAAALAPPVGSLLWDEAALAAALFSVDPAGLGGLLVRSGPGPVRDALIQLVQSLLPVEAPFRRAPLGVADDRLLGGLDLAASLAAGRPIAEQGILALADGGVVVLPMAERIETATAARFASALDLGRVEIERDGMTLSALSRIGLIALDEGFGPDERPPAALLDRLSIHIDLNRVSPRCIGSGLSPSEAEAARRRFRAVAPARGAIIEGLCAAAEELGLSSARPSLLALRVARANAALEGRSVIMEEDAAVAARLVLLPRSAWAAPLEEAASQSADALPPEEAREEDRADQPAPSDTGTEELKERSQDEALSLEQVVDAIRAALPEGVFEKVKFKAARRNAGARGRGAGAAVRAAARGRPTGSRSGVLKQGDRLNLPDTLRAAVPWQKIRSRGGSGLIEVRQQDFRIRRFAQRLEATTIFVVDASGSSALQRLAEVKGAVELLLARAYVTRARVALIAFRQASAEVLLAPTRSLTRAKRQLADLPGGGGTPLAAGIEAGLALASAEKAKHHTPLLVFLTDGRANVGRGGAPGRAVADADALSAARKVLEAGIESVYIDTSSRPRPDGARFAEAMGAAYALLPYVKGVDLDGLVASLSERR